MRARSLRKDKPFVKVNCAALPTELLESELFGFERGAFTGAIQHKPGKFEFANHGTMFLDEIGDMSFPLQAKLLQVLQDGEFSRLGGKHDVHVDVRVVAATNRDLEQAVADGQFREDLFFRLNVVTINLPPLRERREEIPVLTDHFLKKYSVQYNKPYAELSRRDAAPVHGVRLAGQRPRAREPDQADGGPRRAKRRSARSCMHGIAMSARRATRVAHPRRAACRASRRRRLLRRSAAAAPPAPARRAGAAGTSDAGRDRQRRRRRRQLLAQGHLRAPRHAKPSAS